MRIEYELDQWEWQGTTRSIDVDREDFEGMTDEQIKDAVYDRLMDDARQNMHLVYDEDDVVRELKEEAASGDDTDA